MATLRELVFLAPADDVERWSDALLEAGALSVQAEDADADSADEQALYGEPGMPVARIGWKHTRLTALVGDSIAPELLLDEAAAAADLPAPERFELRDVPDRDWVTASQSQFTPIRVGRRLLITPSWHLEASGAPGLAEDRDESRSAEDRDTSRSAAGGDAVPAAGLVAIVLDPGLAFGTGSHPTTHLCLQWLDEHLRAGQTVIDYGCGSGILAIAAARLGASRVVAVDIDPQAVTSASDNARINAVDIEVQLTTAPAPEPADVVVANILSSPLKVLAPMLSTLVRPGGSLVLAGLLDRQVDEVAAAYPALDLSVYASRDGWSCLAGRRR